MVARRREYDAALDAFSVPLMRLNDCDEDAPGVVTVKNDTTHLRRFFDATAIAETLYGCAEETVRRRFRRKLEFVVAFQGLRRDIEAIVGLPDRKANLFIRRCLQNNGRLSPEKRRGHFTELTNHEVLRWREQSRSIYRPRASALIRTWSPRSDDCGPTALFFRAYGSEGRARSSAVRRAESGGTLLLPVGG